MSFETCHYSMLDEDEKACISLF